MGSRLLVYDRTCARPVGLSTAWWAGSGLYRGLGRIDAARGVSSWKEALDWLGEHDEPIAEVQYWGHGKWGAAFVDRDVLDANALSPRHRLHRGMEALRERLVPGALLWFRTCETLGAASGIDFARRMSDYLGARVAGHTFIIGVHQSGLHGIAPGAVPDWSPSEGLVEGTPEEPRRARWSGPREPRTITCFSGAVPEGWFSPGAGS